MFFDWWMIIIIIALIVLYGEMRYRDSIRDNSFLLRAEGAMNTILNLENKGLIKFEDDGTFVGMNDTRWNPAKDPVDLT